MSNPLRAITMRAREYARRDREMSNEEAMGLAIAGAGTLVLLGGAYYWLQKGKKTPVHDQITLILGVMCGRVDATTILGDKAALGAIKKELEALQGASKESEGVLQSLSATEAALLEKKSAFDTLNAALAAKEREFKVINGALAEAQARVETSGGASAEHALTITEKEAAIKLLTSEKLTLENQLGSARKGATEASAETARVKEELASHISNHPLAAEGVTELRNQLEAAKIAEKTANLTRDAAETRAATAAKEAEASRKLAEESKGAAEKSAGLEREKGLLEGEVGDLKREAGRTAKQIEELQKTIKTQGADLAELHQVKQQLSDSQKAAKLAQDTAAARSDYGAVKAERDRLTVELVEASKSIEQLNALLLTARDRADAAQKEVEAMPTVKIELETAKSALLAKEAALLASDTELCKVRDQIVKLQTQVSDLSSANTAIAGATQRADHADARLAGMVATRDVDIAKAVKGAEAVKDAMIAILRSANDELTKELSECAGLTVTQNAEIQRLMAREAALTLGGQAVTADLKKSEAAVLVAKNDTAEAKKVSAKAVKEASSENARKLAAEEGKAGSLQKQVDELKAHLLCLQGEKVQLEAHVALLGGAGRAVEGQRDEARIALDTANHQLDLAVGSAIGAGERALVAQGQSANYVFAVQNDSIVTSNALAAILAVMGADQGGGVAKAHSLVSDSERLADLERQIHAATDALDAVLNLVRDLGSTLSGRTEAGLKEPKREQLDDAVSLDNVARQVNDLNAFLGWISQLVKADKGAEHMDTLRGLLTTAGGTAVGDAASDELKGVIVAFGSLIESGGSSIIARLETAHKVAGLATRNRPNMADAGGGVAMDEMARYVVGLIGDLFAAGRTGVARRPRAPRPALGNTPTQAVAEIGPTDEPEKEQSAGKRLKPSVVANTPTPKEVQSTEVRAVRKRRASEEEGDDDGEGGPEFGVESARALPMGASLWGHMLGCARRIARARAGAALTLDGARATSAAIGWLLRIVESKLIVRARLEKMSLLPPAAQSFGRGCRGPVRRARMYI